MVWTFARCNLTDSDYRTRFHEGRADTEAPGGEAVVLILATDGLWEFITDQVGVCLGGSATHVDVYHTH